MRVWSGYHQANGPRRPNNTPTVLRIEFLSPHEELLFADRPFQSGPLLGLRGVFLLDPVGAYPPFPSRNLGCCDANCLSRFFAWSGHQCGLLEFNFKSLPETLSTNRTQRGKLNCSPDFIRCHISLGALITGVREAIRRPPLKARVRSSPQEARALQIAQKPATDADVRVSFSERERPNQTCVAEALDADTAQNVLFFVDSNQETLEMLRLQI
ncbi:hypothetical protein AWB82_05915 [Caballeronia glebae]|uniref:Uncharacterized protein n=1 Tax=Caballeronia glebae TaxID=1777143 RepID=A0A158CWG4_9BURK|nr:hypothetical protein AWB82_05915 [Caballeronia glebae]